MLGRSLKVALFLLKLLAMGTFYATPLVGFWVASALAAYLGSPVWLAWTLGLLVFPVVPVLWEFRAYRRRNRSRPRWFTLRERLSMRTFVVGLAFLAALIYLFPRTAFVALSTRGDWMLDGRTSPTAAKARRILFKVADGLEGLYRLTKANPYEAFVEHQVDRASDLLPAGDGAVSPWPWRTELHPLLAAFPASEETSIESVARYIARHESDPFQRLKALHDWVADRIAYDAPSFYAGHIPRQDAATVFQKRIGVCAGYANLLAAMGQAINEKIVVVVGDARSDAGKLSGLGHAWNAARVGGKWFLIDATWDSGHCSPEKGFVKQYSTQYLCPPPKAMITDHLPKDPAWQLIPTPVTPGDFLRQPMLSPAFLAAGLELVSPSRAQTEAAREAVVVVKNPRSCWLMIQPTQGEKELGPCTRPTSAGTAMMSCPLPATGNCTVKLYCSQVRNGSYPCVGSLDFAVGGAL